MNRTSGARPRPGLNAPTIAVLSVSLVALLSAFSLILALNTHRSAQRTAAGAVVRALNSVAEDFPELAPHLAEAAAGAASADRGTSSQGGAPSGALSAYGLTPDTAARLLPEFSAPFMYRALLIGIHVLLPGVTAAGAYLTFRAQGRRIERLAELARTVAEGDYRMGPSEELPGAVGRLSHQIRRSGRRLWLESRAAGRAQTQLRELLADISHQLKTPMASVRMYQELTRDYAIREHEGKAKEFAERSLAQLDRMSWLVGNLLRLARLESGQTELDLRAGDLRSTLSETIGLMRGKAEERSLILEADLPSAEVRMDHDPDWLREALSNLIDNALNHSPPGGTVRIHLVETTVFARISVEDEGPGVKPEDVPLLFQRFRRGGAGGPDTGTGLGLTLVKAIVDRHQGVVGARGSTFTVTLPKLTKL